ncbi:MAG: SCO family protein [Labilithrix sp.]|nr:SCO family protein [Labilithrix sp.]
MKTSHESTTFAATLIATVACVLALLVPGAASAQIASTPRELEHVGVNEHLDGPLPLDAAFRDHTGAPVTLRKYFDGKRPVVLQFAYHTCPVVCGMITNNLAAGLKGVPWTIGKEYDVVTISIDPNESLEKTVAKRTGILAEYGRDHTRERGGWHFLSGDAAAIEAVTKAAGFEYQYDERQKQWGHPSVVFVVKPNGRMARYLYGLEFPSADLRLGLLEASEGRHITTVEQLILYCYHYDPQGGKYVLVAQRVMQVGGGAVALVLFGFLGLFWSRELMKKKNTSGSDGDDAAGPNGKASRGNPANSGRERLDPTAVSVRGG